MKRLPDDLLELGDIKGLVEVDTSKKAKPPGDLIPGIIPKDLSILYGEGGVGKTIVAILIAIHIALGRPLWGKKTRKCLVVYLDTEMGQESLNWRVRQVALGMGLPQPPKGLVCLSTKEPYRRIKKTLRAFLRRKGHHWTIHRDGTVSEGRKREVFLVIDSLGAFLGDLDAIKAHVINPIMSWLASLGCWVMVVDHQAVLLPGQEYQTKGVFGSSYKRHRARAVWQVEAAHTQACLEVVLRHQKANFVAQHEPILLKLFFEGDSVVVKTTELEETTSLRTKAGMAEERVLRRLRAGRSLVSEIRLDLPDLTDSAVRGALHRLKGKGHAAQQEQLGAKKGDPSVWHAV